MHIKLLPILVLLFLPIIAFADNGFVINKKNLDKNKTIGKHIQFYEDVYSRYDINSIQDIDFKDSHSDVPNFGMTNSTIWLRIILKNNSDESSFLLNLSQPLLDQVTLYSPLRKSKGYNVSKTGESLPFNHRKYDDPSFLFDVNLPPGKSAVYYIKISSKESIQIPLKIGSKNSILAEIKTKGILSGLYVGVMLVMILYNLFIYYSVKDKSYIYYVVYISIVLLTQTILQGYPFQYLWPNSPTISQYSFFIVPIIVGIVSLAFMNVFLKTERHAPKLFRLSYIISIPYLVAFLFAVFGWFEISLPLMEASAGIVSLFMLYSSIVILRRGYSPAKYFIVAWSVFLCGVIIYILKDFGILPFNDFTRYTMQIGSGIETILLSFALAARINIYKKERLMAVQEKEEVLRKQNVLLEQKVQERTKELNETLDKLKNTQVQLVESEKMSSLGQLTAGVAHEINNPINFVSSNVGPLRQDIDDIEAILKKYDELTVENVSEKLEEVERLKQELDYNYLKTELASIVDGIEDGAIRTTEIVKGLRNFSRLDENELKKADINSGIESSLILLKKKIGSIRLETDLCQNAEIECNPGKINQVIMNILDNAVKAVNDRYEDLTNGHIQIETRANEDEVELIIRDNGKGIPENIRSKIFDPFFTTRDVGQGTGLGLSIVKGILDNHNAKYSVKSIMNEGTTFSINLPKHANNG
tara:strand:+ start:127239 stop:129344 length:2106 start_codon:yes stop_codon:yes gene_type:complete